MVFTSYVFHPLVDPKSGELELYAKFPEWDPELHYTVSVLTYIKKIFYMKDYYTEGGALNQEVHSNRRHRNTTNTIICMFTPILGK